MPARPLAAALALGLLVVAAPAASATHTLGPLPRVSAVAPDLLSVGEVMTLKGENFIPGRMRNSVVFLRPGIRPVFVLAEQSTDKLMRVRVPAKLLPFLALREGQPVPTRFGISVLSQRLSPQITSFDSSPVISPPGQGSAVPGAVDCDRDGTADTPDPSTLGVPVVGLPLAGLPAPGVDVRGVPDVVGLPGIEDVSLPLEALPALSAPEPPDSEPVCPAP